MNSKLPFPANNTKVQASNGTGHLPSFKTVPVNTVLMLGAGWMDGGYLMSKIHLPAVKPKRRAWNKGRIVGQKLPLLPKQVWAIQARLELAEDLRDLALFNLAIDSKLRSCNLVSLKVVALVVGDHVRERMSVIQSKTQRPVQFEVSEGTRDSIWNWVCSPGMLVVTYPKTSHVNALLRLLRYTPRKRAKRRLIVRP